MDDLLTIFNVMSSGQADNNAIQMATEHFNNIPKDLPFFQIILSILTNHDISPPIRILSCISLKNICNDQWNILSLEIIQLIVSIIPNLFSTLEEIFQNHIKKLTKVLFNKIASCQNNNLINLDIILEPIHLLIESKNLAEVRAGLNIFQIYLSTLISVYHLSSNSNSPIPDALFMKFSSNISSTIYHYYSVGPLHIKYICLKIIQQFFTLHHSLIFNSMFNVQQFPQFISQVQDPTNPLQSNPSLFEHFLYRLLKFYSVLFFKETIPDQTILGSEDIIHLAMQLISSQIQEARMNKTNKLSDIKLNIHCISVLINGANNLKVWEKLKEFYMEFLMNNILPIFCTDQYSLLETNPLEFIDLIDLQTIKEPVTLIELGFIFMRDFSRHNAIEFFISLAKSALEEYNITHNSYLFFSKLFALSPAWNSISREQPFLSIKFIESLRMSFDSSNIFCLCGYLLLVRWEVPYQSKNDDTPYIEPNITHFMSIFNCVQHPNPAIQYFAFLSLSSLFSEFHSEENIEIIHTKCSHIISQVVKSAFHLSNLLNLPSSDLIEFISRLMRDSIFAAQLAPIIFDLINASFNLLNILMSSNDTFYGITNSSAENTFIYEKRMNTQEHIYQLLGNTIYALRENHEVQNIVCNKLMETITPLFSLPSFPSISSSVIDLLDTTVFSMVTFVPSFWNIFTFLDPWISNLSQERNVMCEEVGRLFHNIMIKDPITAASPEMATILCNHLYLLLQKDAENEYENLLLPYILDYSSALFSVIPKDYSLLHDVEIELMKYISVTNEEIYEFNYGGKRISQFLIAIWRFDPSPFFDIVGSNCPLFEQDEGFWMVSQFFDLGDDLDIGVSLAFVAPYLPDYIIQKAIHTILSSSFEKILEENQDFDDEQYQEECALVYPNSLPIISRVDSLKTFCLFLELINSSSPNYDITKYLENAKLFLSSKQ